MHTAKVACYTVIRRQYNILGSRSSLTTYIASLNFVGEVSQEIPPTDIVSQSCICQHSERYVI